MSWTPVQEELNGLPLTSVDISGNIIETGMCSAYELSHTPITQTFSLFLNSGFQRLNIDYTLSGSTVYFDALIPSGDNVFATYFWSDAPEPFSPQCADQEPVTPPGVRGSTTLNPVVTSYELLLERIKMQIGWPMTNIEICDDQIYDFINQACEWYSKYAGFTEEYLIFCSDIYQCGYGIKLDDIFNRITDYYCPYTDVGPDASSQFYDCDLNNYRKVAGIFSIDPAGGQGFSTEVLFNIDYMFAQQAYFGQMMGGFGYDVTTWHLLKSWLDLRQKMFATHIDVIFNPTTQLLKLIPEPQVATGGTGTYLGIIGCRLEKSVRELVQERWVQRYALALTKIALAHIRGKFGQVTLFGGGTVNATDLMTQGLAEKEAMEKELMDGYGEALPPLFFIG